MPMSEPATPLSVSRKRAVRDAFDRLAAQRDHWIERNRAFHEDEQSYMRFLVPEGARVLELGCGTGHLLAALKPSYGVGIDISPAMIEEARRHHENLTFIVGDIEDPEVIRSLAGPFDAIILPDTIGLLDDCQSLLGRLQALCTRDTRIIVAYYNQLWRPILSLAERLGQKMPSLIDNWLSLDDVMGLLRLSDYDIVKVERRQLLPRRLLGIGRLVNTAFGSLPIVRNFCLRNYVVARSLLNTTLDHPSATVVIPCRNERGNIEPAVQRLAPFCDGLEIIFVEGHSRDGTYEECLRVQAAYRERDIKVMRQDGIGKGDAVRKGFAAAQGDILIILDADLTVPPETIPKFYDALVTGKGNFINGTRMIYPMESGAMRFLNYLANRTFAILFSWLLNQRFSDTLCGTKALTKAHYRQIEAGRIYFGDFDPFGDFDLIFGAAKSNLKFVEIPIRYADRSYGQTQISRFRHGWLLARMVLFAFRKLKAI